jgi:hypothetical protein
MNLKDGDEKDKKGQAKDKIICLYLNSQDKELADKCFVDLEIAVYSWINSLSLKHSRDYSDVRTDNRR